MRSSTVLVLCILCISVDAWVGIIQHDPRSNHLSHCFSEMYKLGAMEKGEEKRLANECALAKCKENRDIGISGCGYVTVEPPRRIVKGDLSKPYPDCCFEIVEDY